MLDNRSIIFWLVLIPFKEAISFPVWLKSGYDQKIPQDHRSQITIYYLEEYTKKHPSKNTESEAASPPFLSR